MYKNKYAQNNFNKMFAAAKCTSFRSNLSSRFAVTNDALNNLLEFPDLNVPIFIDDMLNKQMMDDGVQLNKLNRTEFIRQLEDFR